MASKEAFMVSIRLSALVAVAWFLTAGILAASLRKFARTRSMSVMALTLAASSLRAWGVSDAPIVAPCRWGRGGWLLGI